MPRCYHSRLLTVSLWTVVSLLMYLWYSIKETNIAEENRIQPYRYLTKVAVPVVPSPAFTISTTTHGTNYSHKRPSLFAESKPNVTTAKTIALVTTETESNATTINMTITTTTAGVPLSTMDPMDLYFFPDTNRIPDKNGVVNPHPFVFTMNPSKACARSDIFLLVYIHSHPDNFDRRQIVRETWGNVSNYKNTVVVRVFVMGQTTNPLHQHLLQMEHMHYGDIIQENFSDTYRNLTYKAVGGLKWVSTYCRHATYVLKTDDDAFVNMFVVLRHLKSKLKFGQYGNGTLACNAWYNNNVARAGKWGVTLEQRKHPVWPTFCQGLAYFMTPDVVADLYAVSFKVPYLWMDDVYVTGFLARAIGIRHKRLDQAFIRQQDVTRCVSGSHWYRCLFSHVNNLEITRTLWNTLLKKPGLPTLDA